MHISQLHRLPKSPDKEVVEALVAEVQEAEVAAEFTVLEVVAVAAAAFPKEVVELKLPVAEADALFPGEKT